MTNDRRVTGLRRRMSEIENDLIDELTSGRIDRREFLRHGSVLGLGMPLL
jgi:peptide/nickel transport system substrate-binding protein